MNKYTRTIISTLGAALFLSAPTLANADRVYFLVGSQHVFRVGTDPYANVDQRIKIEQDYADQVTADMDQSNGADSSSLNQQLDALASQRDQQLADIYVPADYELNLHPELRIEGDGPYQLMGIDFHWLGQLEVFESYMVYVPWVGYQAADRPYGWEYDHSYSLKQLRAVHLDWHTRHKAEGGRFYVGLCGHHGPVQISGGLRLHLPPVIDGPRPKGPKRPRPPVTVPGPNIPPSGGDHSRKKGDKG